MCGQQAQKAQITHRRATASPSASPTVRQAVTQVYANETFELGNFVSYTQKHYN